MTRQQGKCRINNCDNPAMDGSIYCPKCFFEMQGKPIDDDFWKWMWVTVGIIVVMVSAGILLAF